MDLPELRPAGEIHRNLEERVSDLEANVSIMLRASESAARMQATLGTLIAALEAIKWPR